MKFYIFTQNNSGGRFIADSKLCHHLVIEAESEKEAIQRAEELGVYFDGVENDIDCECCGDRWDEPSVLDPQKNDVKQKMQSLVSEYKWTSPEVRVFYADGNVDEFF